MFKNKLDGLQRIGVAKFTGLFRNISFNGMGQGVNPCFCCDEVLKPRSAGAFVFCSPGSGIQLGGGATLLDALPYLFMEMEHHRIAGRFHQRQGATHQHAAGEQPAQQEGDGEMHRRKAEGLAHGRAPDEIRSHYWAVGGVVQWVVWKKSIGANYRHWVIGPWFPTAR